jgi:P63C domain
MNESVPKAEYIGELHIGDMTFPCSVLADGTRILTQSDFMKGMGMYYSGWIAKERQKGQSADLPHFLSLKSLKPFIDKNLGDLQSIVVKYKTSHGKISDGIKAEIIPKICEVWLDADEQGRLGSRQKQIAEKAKILIRALAHVGIIALVDEATGYQELRDKRALQIILDKYIAKEFLAWTKTFPDEFYKEMFRLKGWSLNPVFIKRPSVIGTYTKDIVYDRLAPGVLKELERVNPTTEKGYRKQKHFQWLTGDIGNPHLKEHIVGLIALMKASSNWRVFCSLLQRAYPRQGDQIDMGLEIQEAPETK